MANIQVVMSLFLASDTASVFGGSDAELLLDRHCTPEAVHAVALRADQLRFLHSLEAVEVAKAAVRALGRIPFELLNPSLITLTWAIYGSALRSAIRFEEAEVVLRMAARFAPQGGLESEAEVARRLASLRADQRRPEDVHALLPTFLEWGEQVGGRTHGQELLGAGSILIRVYDFAGAARLTEESLRYLTAKGDQYYVSAVYNLANCRLELASTKADLAAGFELVNEVTRYLEPDTNLRFWLYWLRGKYFRRQGRLEDGLRELQTAQAGIDARGDGMDQALLMLDLADLHLDRDDPQAAQQLALASFPTLKLLRTNSEAYRALKIFHQAAQDKVLDSAVIASVRDLLRAS